MTKKIYVKILISVDRDGNIKPQKIEWEDGRKFIIDKVLDIRRAASLKAGGIGMRYTCRIGNKQFFLFNEDNKWFVEANY